MDDHFPSADELRSADLLAGLRYLEGQINGAKAEVRARIDAEQKRLYSQLNIFHALHQGQAEARSRDIVAFGHRGW